MRATRRGYSGDGSGELRPGSFLRLAPTTAGVSVANAIRRELMATPAHLDKDPTDPCCRGLIFQEVLLKGVFGANDAFE